MKRFAFLLLPAIIFGIFIYFATKEPSAPDADSKRKNDSLRMVKKQKEFEKEAMARAQARAEENAKKAESADDEVKIERQPEPIPFDKETFRELLEMKKMPCVKNLRKALNDISQGRWATRYVEDGIREMMDFGEDAYGNPVNMDFSMFNSKIFLLSVSDAPMGGYQVEFYFGHDQRQFFSAWMYTLEGKDSKSILRAMHLLELSETDIDNALFNMSNYIDKPELTL
jgi:hypothetical protein